MKEESRIICRAEVAEVLALTHDVRELRLTLIDPPELFFRAGQFITIEVTEMHDGHLRQNNRPYSLASSPDEKGVIRLCVNQVGSGPGSTYLHALKSGDSFLFSSPIGFFTVNDEAASALLFIATGTGIAPIKSMIHHLLQTGSRRAIRLYWGLRHEEDLYYQEELALWSERYPHFQYVTTLSQPSSMWQGTRGRVTQLLPDAITVVDSVDAYLCGIGAMIKEVRSLLMAKGMPPKSIHFEKFY